MFAARRSGLSARTVWARLTRWTMSGLIAIAGPMALPVLAAPAAGTPPEWNLTGQVLDLTTWLPVEGATVRLEPGGQEMVTGPDGEYRFAVEPGRYTVSASYAGRSGSEQLLLDTEGIWWDLYLWPAFVAH